MPKVPEVRRSVPTSAVSRGGAANRYELIWKGSHYRAARILTFSFGPTRFDPARNPSMNLAKLVYWELEDRVGGNISEILLFWGTEVYAPDKFQTALGGPVPFRVDLAPEAPALLNKITWKKVTNTKV